MRLNCSTKETYNQEEESACEWVLNLKKGNIVT